MRRALIVGVNGISISVARLLINNGYDATFIVKSEHEGQVVRDVPAYVYVSDQVNEEVLDNAGIDKAELVLSFADDETNLKVASIARSRGVPVVMALVNDKENYLDRFIELGVYAIPIVDAVISKIAHYLRMPFKQLLFADELVQAYYVVISMDSPYLGDELGQLERRCGVSIPLVIRGNEVILGRDNLSIEAGDKLLIVGRSDAVVRCVEKLY
ncbi:potassium channel family protein [Vulcanisaeta thermophila]|uniref:potassium channel family protein n=1 Tax=Vulcanisaeta thermophila TaxID=867917 RepID=UPI000852FBC3|nr:NAD-binding protein [Vulcanisaeta thermophila]